MSYRSRFCVFAMLAGITATAGAQPQEVYVSADLVPSATGENALSTTSLLGSRFNVVSPLEVTAVGGNMRGAFAAQNMFAAIVALVDGDNDGTIDDVPQGKPFNAGEVIASATFSLNAGLSTDVRVPLSVTLQPGRYALIFGSGLFGATPAGEGNMPSVNQTSTTVPVAADLVDSVGAGSYFFWNPNSGPNGTWFSVPFAPARFVVVGQPANQPPVADAVIQQLTAIGSFSMIRLDATGSSDAESANTELTYQWIIDGIEICNGDEATCAMVQTVVAFGQHEIRLIVTDPGGASGEAVTNVQFDPAALSVLEIRRARVKFRTAPRLTKIDLVGSIGLPPGVDFSELAPQGSATLSLANIPALPQTGVSFARHGSDGHHWRFDGVEDVAGIDRFSIDWRGARYRFHERGFPVRLSSDMITSQETLLELRLRPSQIDAPFNIDIDGLANVDFDADGNVTQSSLAPGGVIVDVPQRRISLELPFPITASSVITFSGGLTNTIPVGDDLRTSIGRFRMKILADSALFPDGAATTPRTIDLGVTVGAQAYPGATTLEPSSLTAREEAWNTTDDD